MYSPGMMSLSQPELIMTRVKHILCLSFGLLFINGTPQIYQCDGTQGYKSCINLDPSTPKHERLEQYDGLFKESGREYIENTLENVEIE